MNKFISNAKINLAIDILGTDENNYHIVDMLMVPVELSDNIYINKIKNSYDIIITSNNTNIPLDKRNICYKAVKLIAEKLDIADNFHIHIDKNIPVGGGLGGGSSNAAALLMGLNDMYGSKLSYLELKDIAKQIGADVAFFLTNKFSRATHYGEDIEVLGSIKSNYCLLVNPNINVSTKDVYMHFDEIQIDKKMEIKEIIKNIKDNNVYTLKQLCYNFLEYSTFDIYKEIFELKKFILENTNTYLCLMSGSGSTVFSLYEDSKDIDKAMDIVKNKYPEYKVISTKLKS